MAFRLLYHPDVATEDLPEIDARMKESIERAIRERLGEYPLRFGAYLRGSLKGHKKLRVGDYRVVYRVVKEEVWILGMGHRSNIYRKIHGRLH